MEGRRKKQPGSDGAVQPPLAPSAPPSFWDISSVRRPIPNSTASAFIPLKVHVLANLPLTSSWPSYLLFFCQVLSLEYSIAHHLQISSYPTRACRNGLLLNPPRRPSEPSRQTQSLRSANANTNTNQATLLHYLSLHLTPENGGYRAARGAQQSAPPSGTYRRDLYQLMAL